MVTIIKLAGKKQGHNCYCTREECQVCINEELHWLKTWIGVLVL